MAISNACQAVADDPRMLIWRLVNQIKRELAADLGCFEVVFFATDIVILHQRQQNAVLVDP